MGDIVMANTGPRIKREKQTISDMIKIYCRKQHGTKGELCSECRELMDYAMARLDHCKFGEEKAVCGKCTVHCYKPEMRQRVVSVMKFAGPKMVWYHPFSAIRHLIESRKVR